MSDFPSLSEVLTTHQAAEYSWGVDGCESPCKWDGPGEAHPAHQAQMWQESCAINTVEQLDALPHLSLITYHYESAAGWKLHEVWERRNDSWYCLAAPLNPPGNATGVPPLPALLVWHPNWVST